MKKVGEDIGRRLPRLIMSLVMAIIFWIVSAVIPPTVGDITLPGLAVNLGFLIWTVSMVITAVFLIRALADAIALGDVVTEIIVRKLGIKEERSPKRAARELIYIIIVILVATAVSPILNQIGDIGYSLTIVVTYLALGIIILLIYDIGRTLYRIVEQRAEVLATRLVKMTRQKRKKKGSE